MAITVTEPTATRDSNLSYYVASDNPIIFTFTADAGETQAQIQIYDDTTGTGVLINPFDIVLSFDASNEIEFDVSPYLRSLMSNVNDFNYTSDAAADTNASIKFYIDYAEFDPSPSYTSTNTFTAVKSAKQIGDTFGGNLAEFVDFTTQVDLQELNTPSKTLPYWSNYPFSLEGILNGYSESFTINEYLYNSLVSTFSYNVTDNDLLNHFLVTTISNPDKLEFYLDTTQVVTFQFSVNTANTSTGSSTSTQFQLPLISTGAYNFTVLWGDGTNNIITSWNQAETLHDYAGIGGAGTYNISIIGTIEGWRFANTGDKEKLLNVSSWGNLTITQDQAFFGCVNFTCNATDVFTVTGTQTAADIFNNCQSFNWNNLEAVDWSSCTGDKSGFLRDCIVFNSPLQDINLPASGVCTNFMNNAALFNQPLNNLALINGGTGFFGGFLGTAYNQLVTNWTFANSTNLSGLFQQSDFNQPVPNFDTSNVTTFNAMFRLSPFNQDVSHFNISSLTNASLMFLSNTAFSTANYDLLLDVATGWSSQATIQSGVPLAVNSTKYTKTETFTGANTSTSANQLVDVGTDFTTGTAVQVGDAIYNSTTGSYALVTGITNAATGVLDLNANIFTGTPENYSVRTSNAAKGKATLISVHGWTITDSGGI